MTTTYQVGDLMSFAASDPVFPERQAAVELALSKSSQDDRRPFGVWTGQGHGSELVAIAYQGQLFSA